MTLAGLAVARGADAVRQAHGADGVRYLRTLARYAADAWPGIEEAAAVEVAAAPQE